MQTFTAPDESTTLTESDVLGGGDILPGLSLPVKTIFEDLEPEPAQKMTSTGQPKGPRNPSRGNKRKT